MSRVCSIHEEFCPDDECRWCDPPGPEPETRVIVAAEALGLGMIYPQSITGGIFGILAGNGNQTQQVVVPPPNQPTPGKHLWGANGCVCALCGLTAQQIYGTTTPCRGAP